MFKKRMIALSLVMVLLFGGCAGQSSNSDLTKENGETTAAVGEGKETQKSSEEVTQPPTTAAAITLGSAEAGTYTVNDPENTRGLSTQAYGFSFGVARDGKPHQITIDNQKRFDSIANVEALAWDSKTTDKVIYLTFDCGYEYNNNTGKILDVLKEKDVKVTFFCTLPFLKTEGDKVKRMILEGHNVGNHSTTHPVFTDISRTKMAEELFGVHKYLLENYGYTAKYFRFPTGKNSDDSLELVTSQGYKSIFWSIAYKDYDTASQPTEEEAFKTITDRLHPGCVILLHAVSDTNTKILAKFIDYARENGYTFKSLDDYYSDDAKTA